VPELTDHKSIRNEARQGKIEYPGHDAVAKHGLWGYSSNDIDVIQVMDFVAASNWHISAWSSYQQSL